MSDDSHLQKLINMNILQVKKTLPSDQRRVTGQAKFTYSLIEKFLEKQRKAFENQGKNQAKTI